MSHIAGFLLWIVWTSATLVIIANWLPVGLMSPVGWIVGNQIVRLVVPAILLLGILHHLSHKRRLRALGLAVIVVIVLIEHLLYIPVYDSNPRGGGQNYLRVVTFNCQQLDPSRWIEYWNKTTADLAVVNEVSAVHVDRIIAWCGEAGWHCWYLPINASADVGSLIMSRSAITPLDSLSVPSLKYDHINVMIAQTAPKGIQTTIAAMHLEPVRVKRLRNINAECWRLRREQAEIIADELIQYEGRVIICGDFNATPTDKSIAPLRSGFRDSWIDAGVGLGGTWESNLPLFRIDYILHRGFDGTGAARTIFFKNSDHRGYEVNLHR